METSDPATSAARDGDGMLTVLPYAADDDAGAETYIREAIRQSQRGNWVPLLADDRVMQTHRVLRAIRASAIATQVRRREEIAAARHERDAGLLSPVCFAERYREFTDWSTRATVFNSVLDQYLDMTTDRVRVLNRDPFIDSLRRTLLAMAFAVDDHRNTHSGEESLADRALWARLRLLPWPDPIGAETSSLADAVAAERARHKPARHTEDLIGYGPALISGVTIDVVDLVLELTNVDHPTCDREHLRETWKRRTPDLTRGPHGCETTNRRKGNLASSRLYRAIVLLESLNMLARTQHDGQAYITVTNRARLTELRHRWTREHPASDPEML